MKVTPDTFGHLTHYLKGLANGRVMVLLEVKISLFGEIEILFLYII